MGKRQQEALGGVALLIAAIIAMSLANSPLGHAFEETLESNFRVGSERFYIDEPLHFWINDAMMAIFFFVVGLGVKRALILGELASVRSAALPIVAALGGMVVPAGFYLLLNGGGGEAARGWGIPMSTDIAFSLGVLALLGTRAPLSLKVFLSAFAIVDDIGAILVIAVFFTETINWLSLGIALALVALLVVLSSMRVRSIVPYFLISVAIWVALFDSGVHATIAGVLVAMVVPLRIRIAPGEFVGRGRQHLAAFARDAALMTRRGDLALTTDRQREAIEQIEIAAKQVESPLQRLEHVLHPWVAFAIMPIFALANAHIPVNAELMQSLGSPVTLGVIAGLLLGKPVGIVAFCWIAVKIGAASLPPGISWRQILGVALIGGIGLTVSIFITDLAFDDRALVLQAKLGIFVASIIAGASGYFILRYVGRPDSRTPARAAPRPAAAAGSAERSAAHE